MMDDASDEDPLRNSARDLSELNTRMSAAAGVRLLGDRLFLVASGPQTSLSFLKALAIFVIAVGGATAIRTALLPYVSALPFVFYFPAIVIVGVFAGGKWGFASLIASVLLAWYLFIPPEFSFDISTRDALGLVVFALSGSFVLAFPLLLRQSLVRLRASELRYRQLAGAASGLTWVTNAQGQIQEPQEAWTLLTGMAWPTYRGYGWISAIHPDDVEKVRLGWLSTSSDASIEFRIKLAHSSQYRWFVRRSTPVGTGDGDTEEWLHAMVDVDDLKSVQERLEIINGELRHRLKNLMTVIGAIVKQSRPKNDPAINDFIDKFLGRLYAILRTGEAVLASKTREPAIREVADLALAPFIADKGPRQIHFEGPYVIVSEPTAGSLALAFHELATNSIKYGALAAENGAVALTWRIEESKDIKRVSIEWKESGGAPPQQPAREGFGTRVIQAAVAREQTPDVRQQFEPDGLRCTISYDSRAPARAMLAIDA
jgi:two-component sensor histidine kinase